MLEGIISACVAIFVMVITLLVQKKISDKQIKSQQQQFESTLKQNDEYYNSSLKLQEENNRVTQLPFLYLNQEIKCVTCQ